MAAIDAEAAEPLAVLIERAGAALARVAISMLGGTYGRRVQVIAGTGNNGSDGRAAARRLTARGAIVSVDPPDAFQVGRGVDLVIDAAFGTGFRDSFNPANMSLGPLVLAADLPSGLDGLTGVAAGRPWRADRTVTFAAWKPGLLFADGPQLTGRVDVADVGLDCSSARCGLVEVSDLAGWIPRRSRDAHKWNAATWVIGGSVGMPGAVSLAALGAWRSGASYVRVSSPGAPLGVGTPESVAAALPMVGWDREVIAQVDRVRSLVVGPGLGRSQACAEAVRRLAVTAPVPLVLDGDALWALGSADDALDLGRGSGRVITPHDGEFLQLTGHPVGVDRVAATRELARHTGAVVVLKGPTTVVAEPAGATRLIDFGDHRLATAGTGDVLAGVIAALLAQGANSFDAATAGVAVHGLAGRRGPAIGMMAGDLPLHIAEVLADIISGVHPLALALQQADR